VYEDPSSFDKDTANVYGYQRAPETAYPYLLTQYLKDSTDKNVKLDQLAMSSMRAEEIRVLLDETYDGDAYTRWRFSAGQNWFERAGGIDKLRAEYKEAVTNADLITLEAGVNNFGVYAINQITSGGKMFDTDLADVFTEEELAKYTSAKGKIAAVIKDELGYADTSTIDLLADTFIYAYVGFAESFDVIIEKINELNPDAEIVVLSIPNMLYGVEAKVPGVDGTVPLGDIFGAVVDMANLYVATLADNRDTYMYAEAGEDLHVETFLDEILAYDGNPESLSINMIDCFNIYDDDLHIKSRIEYMLAGQDQAVIDKALDTAYDIVAEIMYEGASNNLIDLEVMMSDKAGDAETKALKYIEDSVMEGVTAVVMGKDYEFEFDKSLMDDPALATVFCMGVRSSIGNSFFAHPDANGHKEVRDAVVAAIKKGNTAKDDTNELITFEYEVTDDSYYVALGDSTVAGKSYAGKVKSELGLADKQFRNLGMKGMSAKELFDVLETNKADIEKADLITLGFGNGQFIEYMGDFMTGSNEEEIDWTEYIDEKYAQKIDAALAEYRASFLETGMDEEIVDMMLTAVESYAYAYVSFACNYPEAVNKIREMNPDAAVVVVGMYNTLEGMVIKQDDMELPIGEYIEYIVKLTNLHYKTYVLMTENAVYVDAPDVETVKTYGTVNVLGLVNILVKPSGMYPSDKGHEYIKDQIIGAMKPVTPDEPEEPDTPVIPEEPKGLWGDANGDGIVDSTDAMLVCQYDAWMIDETEIDTDVCDVNGDGIVDSTDAMLICQYDAWMIDKFPVEK